MSMRLALAAALLASGLAACGGSGGVQSVTGLERDTPSPPPTPPPVMYTATLTASSACARQLPAGEAVRVYEVTRSASGGLHWSGPTVIEPEGHRQISSLKVDGDSVSLAIGGGPLDPESDIFNGIWEHAGNQELTISGRGSGRVKGAAMSGTFEGDFDSWVDTSNGAESHWTSCHAADHRFELAPR
jgi:hypothetical protein